MKASGIHISGALLMPITHGHVPWQSTDMTTYARSSAGRAAVSKTAGRWIEANRVCHDLRTAEDQPAIAAIARAWS